MHATVFHTLPWVANAKQNKTKKKITTYWCPDKICEFLPAAGRCNRHAMQGVCQAWALVWAGRLPKGKERALAVQGPKQAESPWVSPEPLPRGSEHQGCSCRGSNSVVPWALTSLQHLPHSDRQTQPKAKPSTKSRGITFLVCPLNSCKQGHPHP